MLLVLAVASITYSKISSGGAGSKGELQMIYLAAK
jgi:hypothetical protein